MDMVTVLMTVFLGMLAILGMDGRLAAPNEAERAAATAVTEALQQDVPVQAAPAQMVPEPTRPAAPAAPVPTSPGLPAPPSLTPGNKQWLDRLEALRGAAGEEGTALALCAGHPVALVRLDGAEVRPARVLNL